MSRLNDMVQRKLAHDDPLGRVRFAADPGRRRRPGRRQCVRAADRAAVGGAAEECACAKRRCPAVLPLSAASLSSIVVIGGHADAGVLSGGGSGAVPAAAGNAVSGCTIGVTAAERPARPGTSLSPLAAIKAKAPAATVTLRRRHECHGRRDRRREGRCRDRVRNAMGKRRHRPARRLSLPSNTTDTSNQSYDQNALITAVAAQGQTRDCRARKRQPGADAVARQRARRARRRGIPACKAARRLPTCCSAT